MDTVISSKEQHMKYLAEIEKLMDQDPANGTPDFERLQLLALAVDEFERKSFTFEQPTAVEAIKFRMEEQGLKQTDLIPYIGSKSKVSEVISGKRGLSIPMIRALNQHLKIPLEALMRESNFDDDTSIATKEVPWELVPWKKVQKLGWIKSIPGRKLDNIGDLVEELLGPVGGNVVPSLWRKAEQLNNNSDRNSAAITAWLARAMSLAKSYNIAPFEKKEISLKFLQEVAKLSAFKKGPILAKEFLESRGIKFIVLSGLEGMKVDGACFVCDDSPHR